ncbi:MAG: diguanylate cyclase [Nitrospirae bacterium]|nr:diguanylate cyclase [Nitrospirota bacterium]
MENLPSDTLRYKGYDRIIGNIAWLLIAIVALDIKLLSRDDSSSFPLAVICILLFIYNALARYSLRHGFYGRAKTFIDLIIFLLFTIAVSWFTGMTASPFISLLYLGLMAAALTQGKRVTYLMAALTVTSYTYLAVQENVAFLGRSSILESLLQLFPFMLIAHLGAMLAGETEHARKEVERLSMTDEITGFNNMRSFAGLAKTQEALAKRYNREFSVCMLDADNLKKINDANGHMAGTELIRHMGDMIGRNVRATDIVARYGGDEFIILFSETSADLACVAVERIVRSFADTPLLYHGKELSSTISAGIASFPKDGEDVRAVMLKADEAMYASKAAGKNRLTVCPAAKGPAR